MEVIGHDCVAKQVDPKKLGQPHKFRFHPFFSVIVVLACKRIISQQEAPSDRPIKDMYDRNFIRCKHFDASQPSHHTPPFLSKP